MITEKLFDGLFPTAGLNPRKFNLVRERARLIAALNKFLPKYEINNALRLRAFLANCGIETDYFRTTSEYASGWDYDISVNPQKAQSLGNFKKGDGPRYKGSGLSQTTGGYNFAAVQKAIGKILGIDVVKNPEILRENIEVAVESACIFWRDNKLNSYADRGLFKELSGIVNRGDKNKLALHWSKRNELYSLCKRRVPENFSFDAPAPVAAEPVVLTPTSEPVGLTRTDEEVSSDQSPASGETDKSKVKEFSEKYLKHCPQDTAKNVAAVIFARIFASLTTVWTLGLHGKILLIVAALAVVGFSGYAVFKYKDRIVGWAKDIADPLMPS